MKYFFTLIFTLIGSISIAQTLLTYNGPFIDGKVQNGNAVYTYYEDPVTREYLKQGSFKYTFKGKGNYSGYDQTITGNFEKGLKHGTWIYKISMSDFGSGNPYYTGTVTLVANYKNGYADGSWKEVRSYKTRNQYLSYGQFSWEPFGPVKTMTIELNFKNGNLINSIYINDEFAKFKATGNYDSDGLAVGVWNINDVGWNQNQELIYKDNFLYEIIYRDNSGRIISGPKIREDEYGKLIVAKNVSELEREDLEVYIERVCGGSSKATSEVKEYFRKILNNEYYLYSYIKGDLTYESGIISGCEIIIKEKKFKNLADIQVFNNAEKAMGSGDYIKAYTLFKGINLNDEIRPSDRKKIRDKISELHPKVKLLIENFEASTEFIKKHLDYNLDSINKDFNSVKKQFKLKKVSEVRKVSGNVYSNKTTEIEEVINPVSVEDCNCIEPWNESNISVAKLCFKRNPKHYEPYHIAITEAYFGFYQALVGEGNAAYRTEKSLVFDDIKHTFLVYDKQIVVSALEVAKEKYREAKIIKDLILEFDFKLSELERLGGQKKKKIIQEKFKLILPSLLESRNKYVDQKTYLLEINKLNLFLERVINLYSIDTKEIENQLKKIDEIYQIKTFFNSY